MAKPYEISLVANTKGFVSGLANAEDAVEGIGDSLDDLVRAADKSGDKAGDRLADGVESGTDEAAREVDRLAKKFNVLSSEAAESGKKIGKGLGDGTRSGADKAGEAFDDVKDEASQSAKETAASFDGSADSILEMFQEVAANAFAGFGPAGMAAGFAAAVGIAYISQALETAGDDTEAVKEKTRALAEAYIDAGTDGGAGLDFLIDQLRSMATESEDGKRGLKDIKKMADNASESFSDLAQATGNNTEELRAMWRESKKQEDALRKTAEAQTDWTGAITATNAEATTLANQQQDITRYIGEQIGMSEKAAEAQKLYAEAGGPALEVKSQLIDAVADSYDSVRDSAVDAATTEEGAFDIGVWVSYVAEHKAQVEAYKTNLALMRLSPDEWANFLALPEEARSSIASSWSSGDETLRSSIRTSLSDGAGEGGSAAAVAFEDSFTPEANVDVTVEADTSEANAALQAVADTKRTAEIAVKTTGKADAKDALDKLAAPRTASVTAIAQTGAAQAALDSFVSRNSGRTICMTADVRDRSGRPLLT